MDMNKGLVVLIAALLLVGGIFSGMAFTKGGVEIVEVDKIVIQEKLVSKECPVTVCQEFKMPEIENADNALLNEFLESEFSVEYEEIEEAAEEYALEELERKDFRVVEDYIKTLIEGVLDEDSLEVDVDDVEIKVTMLGLDEDEDKSALVTFELEVEYELEEGIVETHKKDLVVSYKVLFDEGDFDDEEVELVSIV